MGAISGTDGNDVFSTIAANSTVFGGNGLDTLSFNDVTPGDISISREADKSSYAMLADKTGKNGTLELYSVERILFSSENKHMALDTDVGQNAGMAYRIYKAAFNRTPDTAGLSYWIGQIDAGMGLVQVAQGFMTSTDEFRNLYGSNPTVSQFVDRLYYNVLGRAGESSGVAYWEWQLNSGAQSMAQVLVGFSESAENVSVVGNTIQDGFFY